MNMLTREEINALVRELNSAAYRSELLLPEDQDLMTFYRGKALGMRIVLERICKLEEYTVKKAYQRYKLKEDAENER